MRLAATLYPYQETGVTFIHTNKHVIIGDEPGLGKTIQALAAISKTGLKALIVVPAYLKRNWEAECENFVPHLTVKVYHTPKGMCPTDHDIVIISYSQLAHAFKVVRGRKFIVFDEVHYIKSPKAQRTTLAHELVEGSRPEYMVGLSGTPVKNRVSEWYTVLGICSYRPRPWRLDILRDFDYWKFCNEFSHKKEFTVKGRRITKFSGTRNIPLLKTYLQGKYLRRVSKGLIDLPPIIAKDVIVNYKDSTDTVLKDAWEAHVNKVQGHTSSGKRDAALSTVKFTTEYVRNLFEETGEPILVFTDHPDVTTAIAEGLKKLRCATITGATPVAKRHTTIDWFQEGRIDVLLATIGSCSTGFNITRTNQVVFNDLSWTPADNFQAVKRVNRIGQGRTTFAHYVSGSKISLVINKNLREKERDLGKLL